MQASAANAQQSRGLGSPILFDRLPAPAADPLYEAMARYNADARAHKCDLGVGVFRDEKGESPVLAAVRAAEQELAQSQRTKAYFPLAGDPQFLERFQALVFPHEEVRAAAIQTAGGTGALRLAFELVKAAKPDARVHLGLPSWPSHAGLVDAVGLELCTYQYIDRQSGAVDFEVMLGAAKSCAPDDIFLLHGPCHNPTGVDLTAEQRNELLNMLARRGAVPVIDLAYWGLAEGLEADLENLWREVGLIETALVAVSCSKLFGLYRERTGALFALTRPGTRRAAVQGNLERLSRLLVSTPPAHGAAVVATILGDDTLRQLWMTEVSNMRSRIVAIRSELEGFSDRAPQLTGISKGRGLFALLPIAPSTVEFLGSEHAIHLPGSGRINITGLKPGDPERLAHALEAIASPR